MNSFLKSDVKIREIDPILINEIELVATRMRQTLVEVLGPEKGTALYTMEWLLERVRWHLDNVPYGYFSTKTRFSDTII